MSFRKRVLVCEDDPVQLAILSAALRQAGYETAAAQTTEDGLKRMLRAPVDAVVSDVHLGRGNGFELVAELRRAGRDVPVLMISGLVTRALKERAIREGVRGLLEKPCDVPSIVRVVRCLVERPESPLDERPILISRPEIVGPADGRRPSSAVEPVRRVGILVAPPAEGRGEATSWGGRSRVRAQAAIWAAALFMAFAGAAGLAEML